MKRTEGRKTTSTFFVLLWLSHVRRRNMRQQTSPISGSTP